MPNLTLPPKVDLLNLTKSELEAFVVDELRQPRFRADQLWHWLWFRGVPSFAAMTNLSRDLKAKLAERAAINWPTVEVVRTSTDGTIKLLLALADGERIETVLIPMGPHYTQCLSTQVGCAMACTFCSTGELGLTRNMTMGEILGQIMVGRAHLAAQGLPTVRNLVFMGMGEPLMNLTELLRSLATLGSADGLPGPVSHQAAGAGHLRVHHARRGKRYPGPRQAAGEAVGPAPLQGQSHRVQSTAAPGRGGRALCRARPGRHGGF
jgi:23S rRNA (adenine2503-C2)-methyltransferase